MIPRRKAARIESESLDCDSLPPLRHARAGLTLKNLSPFDYLVLAGGLVNLGVIGGIIGFWLAGH